ncbi:hypothetical protein G9A89_022106 [Geosiphon pyriformis]|nr:hypothetical protein G9A89_022106 [Geosiphon pyriformis]
MKKTINVSGSKSGFKTVVLRKKRKGGVLAEDIDNREVAAEAPGARLWGSKTSNTTKSESINMEKECLVKETSVDYGESSAFVEGNPNQTPKGLCVKTKKVLGKPLGVIDYGTVNTDNNVLDNFFLLLLPLPIKLTVQVPVHKSFALDINLVVITKKFFQEKLCFIKKIFSGVNGFGRASTPSKLGGIIRATFTLEKAMMAAGKLANDCGVVVNTDLKHPINNHINQTIVIKKIPVRTSVKAVRAAVSEFGLIKSIKMQLVGLWQKAIIELEDQNQADLLAFKWSILIEKDAVHVARANVDKQTWDFRDEFRALLYVCARCVTVCFGSESDLVSVMAATPVIKEIGLYWSYLSLALCSVCSLPGHTSLNCVSVKIGSTLRSRKAPLFAQDQVRLATIYTRKFMPISCPLAFSGKTWASVVGAPLVHSSHGAGSFLGSDNVSKPLPSVVDDLEKRLVNIESSLISLVEQIGELTKRLDSLVPAVFQPSPGYIVMKVSSDESTCDETAAATATAIYTYTAKDSSVFSHVVKLENMLEGLAALVLSLSACFDGLALAAGIFPQLSSQ